MRVRRAALSALVTGAVFAAAAAPAFAATPQPSVATDRANLIAQIDGRLLWSGVQGAVTSRDPRVPAIDRKALVADIKQNAAALEELQTQAKSATTVPELTKLENEMQILHIYEFVLPRVVAVRTSDDLIANDALLAAKVPALEKAVIGRRDGNPRAAKAALSAFRGNVFVAAVQSHDAHSAIGLTRGAVGSEKALAKDEMSNFGSTLRILAAINDARVIEQLTGSRA